MTTKGARKSLMFAAAGGAVLTGVGLYAWVQTHRPAVLEIYVFDTPGSPSMFIRTPEDKRILIDGGSNTDIIRRLTDIVPFYTRRIDTVIATFPDGKNVTGLIDVLNRYSVDQVVIPAVTLGSLGISTTTDRIYDTFIETVERLKIPLKEAQAGERLSFGDAVQAEILFPIAGGSFEYSKASAPELLFKITHGDNSITFIGHASTKVQKLLAGQVDEPTDILITSGSASASNISKEIIGVLSPKYFVYSGAVQNKPSVSKTSKSKPKPDPLATLLKDQRFNIRETAGVKITSDGGELRVERLR